MQDIVLERGKAIIAKRGNAPLPESESLRVYVCSSASLLGMGQAQACIAVVTPEHFYLIDSGAGSTDNINRMGLPLARLQGLLLTHFHSDHIAEIYEVNLGSWVQGRPAPLTVYGPRGVDEVAFYHLVPVPPNSVVEDIFMRGVPDNFLLAEDLMWFELPLNSDDIVVNRP